VETEKKKNGRGQRSMECVEEEYDKKAKILKRRPIKFWNNRDRRKRRR